MKKIKWGIIGLGWFGEYHGDAENPRRGHVQDFHGQDRSGGGQ